MSTPTPEEFLANLGVGIEDVIDKALGEGKYQFTLVIHGEDGVMLTSNCTTEASKIALQLVLDKWAPEP